jgi:putative ATP-dependent endonuclease of the OLD family
MRANSIRIHNFRTFSDNEISLLPYSLLLGVNNCGKSNLIDAIRVFYEKDLKYDEARDFPKYPTGDKESWMEIEYQPTAEELDTLKAEYKTPTNTFRVRKYLQSSELDDEKKPKGGIYAYVNGQLSNTRFYGAKNVSQGKLGDIIYIPAVSRLDDHTKLSGPSALRDLINSVLKKIMDTSPAYVGLKSAFDEFNGKLKGESTEGGHSLQTIEQEISTEIDDWGTSFEFYINPVTPDDLVKTLIGHRIQDKALGQPQDPKCYGQGFQRHLVFTLIKLSAKYTANTKSASGKEFSPQLTWLLFEEPEAFLHPSQIDALDVNLRAIANTEGSQVLITTHNPEFVSKSIEDIPSLIRLCRNGTESTVGQISPAKLKEIFLENQKDSALWIANPNIGISPEDLTEDMESIKYALWLDARRSSAFFASKVLLVEGPTETVLLGYLLGLGQIPSPAGGIFVLDCIGKFNIHRFMNLFGQMRIPHAVLVDNDKGKYPEVDNTIESSRNPYTLEIEQFPEDIEGYLGIPPARRANRKPQHVMWQVQQGKVDATKLQGLVAIAKKVLAIRDTVPTSSEAKAVVISEQPSRPEII